MPISFSDFQAIDLRAGKVVAVTSPDWSQKLLELAIDFGPELGQRTILSGIRQWYQAEDLLGKMVPCVANLAPKKMGEGVSEGMVLMADSTDRPTILYLPDSILPGTVIR